MIAYLDENGYLHIEAETPLESYALNKWQEENTDEPTPDGKSRFTVLYLSWGLPPPSKTPEID